MSAILVLLELDSCYHDLPHLELQTVASMCNLGSRKVMLVCFISVFVKCPVLNEDALVIRGAFLFGSTFFIKSLNIEVFFPAQVLYLAVLAISGCKFCALGICWLTQDSWLPFQLVLFGEN